MATTVLVSTAARPTAAPAPRARRRVRPGKLLLSVLAVVLAGVWVFPVYWMVNSSLLPNAVLQSGAGGRLPYRRWSA